MKRYLFLMLLAGASLIFPFSSGMAETAGDQLVSAVSSGDLGQVRALLDQGVPADARNETGLTALMRAAGEGRLDAVQLLLEAGADPNALSLYPRGVHALTWAVVGNNTEVIETLIQAGARIDVSGRNELSPLGKALFDNSQEAFALLIKHGADVNFPAIRYTRHQRRLAVLTPLMATIFSGNPDFVEPLLERGAKIDATNEMGDTALMLAIKHGRVELARALMEAGADVNVRHDSGYTALLFAAHHDLAEVIELLLAKGADPHATASHQPESGIDYDAAELAWRLGHVASAILLEKAKESTDPLPTSRVADFVKKRRS